MKTLIVILINIFTHLSLAQSTSPFAGIKNVECENIRHQGDHYSITLNFGSAQYALIGGYYTVPIYHEDGSIEKGRQPRTSIVYGVGPEMTANGGQEIAFLNNGLQFQNDRRFDLMIHGNYRGTLTHFICAPGTGGYGPGGIPESTCENMTYQCVFIPQQ